MIRVGVFGAGAIGAYVGARLAHGGADVTLVGRPSILEELGAHGAVLTDYRGFSRTARPRLAASADALAGVSHVIVAVKSGDTADAGAALAGVLAKDAVVVSFQNGVRNPEVLRTALPGRVVLAAMVPFNVVRQGEGRFHQGTSGTLAIEAHPRAMPLLAALERAGLPAVADADVARKQWGKLLVNLGNAVNALSGLPIRGMLARRGYRQVMAALFAEGEAMLREARIRPVLDMPTPARIVPAILRLPDRVFRYVLPVMAKVDDEARSSMADDLMRGRKTEVDFLNGEIVRLGASLGQAAPRNARIVELVHAAEGGAPPLGPEALLTALGLTG